jgi:23S rRNA (guanosine2251-2'-O)-methyltransferase
MHKTDQIYGIRAIIEAINAEKPIDKIFIQRGLKGNLSKELEALARRHGINTSYVPIEKLNRLTKNNHQGAVAKTSPISFYDFEELVEQLANMPTPPLLLLLDQVTDVRNFGAIIRTAECAGVNAIIIPKQGGAPVTADTVKTSAGAVFKVPIAKVEHIKDAIHYLQASAIKVIAATEKTTNTIYDVSFNGPCAIVMGAEGKGISPSSLKAVDEKAKLPLLGEISSLNVSVACGVFLYEAVRQRSIIKK